MTKRRYYITTAPGGTRTYYVESGAGTGNYNAVGSLTGLSLSRTKVPVAKAISRAYPTANSVMDYALYPAISWGDGFVFTDYYRRTDVALNSQFTVRQLMEDKGFTALELAESVNKARVYYEMTSNTLGVYQTGNAFVDASLQTILNEFAAHWNANMVGVPRISFNFENTYLPTITSYDNATDNFDSRGVLQHFTDADTRVWVGESPPVLGQSRTIRQLWEAGVLNEEITQRMVNRHVMLLKWCQAKAGNTTKVVLGDGSLVYQNGSVAFVDDYAALYAATTDRSYVPAFWQRGATFAAITADGTTVSGGNTRLWDIQGWLNNYSYVGQGFLEPADYDTITTSAVSYPSFWEKVAPGPGQDDVNIPTMTVLNRRRLVNYGRPELPVVWQGHNRFEFGVKRRGSEQSTTLFNLGPDGAIMPPYQCEVLAIVCRMAATKAGDGLTVWTTWRQAPANGGATEASNRPLWERHAYHSGLYRLYRHKEYFEPANSPLFIPIDEMYVRYPLAGGDWGSNMRTDGGDGFWKRGAGVIVNHQNPSDARTKVGCMARLITKNGARWALITATNWRQARAQTSPFDLRFKAAATGLPVDVDILGLSVTGWEALVVEVCLQPELLTTAIGS